MNDIIKNIEAAQLKSEITDFKVGDTVKVSAKVKEGNRERFLSHTYSFTSLVLASTNRVTWLLRLRMR